MELEADDLCGCGSNKMYKNCCQGKIMPQHQTPREPPHNEITQLRNSFKSGRYSEAERLADVQLRKYPTSGLVWELYGLSLQMQGKNPLHAFIKTAELLPKDAGAQYNLGLIYRNLGQLKDAANCYLKALEIKPDFAEAHSNLGNVLKELGQFDGALASYRSALKLKPDSAEVRNNLGNVLKELGQFDDALASYRSALTLKPNSAETHNNIGIVLKDLGQLDDAVLSYRQALKLKPDYADAHYNLGNALMELGQFDGAVASYRQAIAVKPDFTSAYINLGGALQELGQLDDAASNYRVAIELKPGFAKTLANLGLVMSDLEQPEGATEYFLRALKIDPDCVEARLGLARLSIQSGDITVAEKMMQDVLKTYPENLEARFLIAKVNKVKYDNENFAVLKELETAARNRKLSISRNQTIGLHFALGKCFDDIGDFERAFSHFSEGCKQKRATLKYDAEKTTRLHDEIIRVFGRETLDRLTGGGSSSSKPIFVLGMPRSGTTLTEQIIASHPEVYGAGELQYMHIISHRDITGKGVDFPGNIIALDRGILSAWAADYVTEIQRRAPNAKYITDKMPHNYVAIGLIHLMFPNAKIIHVNRNPVDTCLSCYTNLFANNNLEYSYDLVELGNYYADYARLMEHWRTVLPADAFLEVQYEDIVLDLENHARRIIRFCCLDWNEACIDFHKSKRSVHTSSMAQVRQPIYKSSVDRWKPYEKYLGPLLETLGDFVPKLNRDKFIDLLSLIQLFIPSAIIAELADIDLIYPLQILCEV